MTATILNQGQPALCLSGGGYRATLFHLGALRRLNELGVLSRVAVITSVSGGSILNGVLATRWHQLVESLDGNGRFASFDQVICRPVREFCSRDLRTRVLFGTRLNPANLGILLRDFFAVPANFLADEYEELMLKAKLVELLPPAANVPRFVFCATNVFTGACWQFHSGPFARMGDFYAGYCNVGDCRVSDAVAASSSFPPGFAGLRLKLLQDKDPRLDPWGELRVLSQKRKALSDDRPRLAILTDGGVYDNLGVEPIWNRCECVLVSDAGRPFTSASAIRQSAIPRLRRAAEISAEQVGAVRKRWLLEQFRANKRRGTLWAIDTLLSNYPTHNGPIYEENIRDLFLGSGSGEQPGSPIQITQHLISPSPIISKLFEQELQKHIKWIGDELAMLHSERQTKGVDQAGTEPISAEVVLNRADPTRRKRIVPHVSTIFPEGMKRGAFWSRSNWNRDDWVAYRIPNKDEISAIVEFFASKSALIFSDVSSNAPALDRDTVLNGLHTQGTALHANRKFFYPHAAFRETIWPHLVKTFRNGHSFFNRHDNSIYLSKSENVDDLSQSFVKFLSPDGDGKIDWNEPHYDFRTASILAYSTQRKDNDSYPIEVRSTLVDLILKSSNHEFGWSSYGK